MIVTFYSYKGGTGRTMALANIAVVLARAGHRVLAVDFDLEAPGLARYFEEITPEPPRTGLIDLLLAESAEPGGPDWRDHVVPIERNLSLLAGGNQDRDYPARVLGFDWGEFFRAGGGEFFERLRADWSAEYDFVLVDSRTGITDTGGVCTITLPDIVVPVFTANHQSVDGVVDVMHRAQAGRQALDYDRPPLVVLPLPARFDGRTERRSAQEWLEIFADRFEPFYQDWLPRGIRPRQILERTKLPYVAYFSFGERLPVRSDDAADPESLGYALHTVAKLIENGLSNAAEVVGLPTEPPAQRVRTDEPRLTVLRRRRRLLPVAHLITSAIALVGTITLLVSQNVALPFRQTIVLAGAAQTGYFDNPEVQRILLRRGFSVRITQAGDRTESPVDLDSAAFVMTTGALSTDALRSQLESAGRSSKSYEPFYSLLVVAGRHEHVAALASAGVATPQENPQFYSLDVQRFLDLLARKPTWNDLGVTPDDARSVAVGTADVCRSGTAAGYLGLAAFAVGSVPATLEDARSIATRLKPLVQQQGTPAPAVPLSDESPLVVTSEHRYFANPFGSVALVYPRTPLRLRQTYTALTPEAERLGDLLVSDPELLRAAARSGYRAYPPADGLFDQARDEQGVARPDAVRDDRFAVLPEPDVFREMVRVVGDCGGSGGG